MKDIDRGSKTELFYSAVVLRSWKYLQGANTLIMMGLLVTAVSMLGYPPLRII